MPPAPPKGPAAWSSPSPASTSVRYPCAHRRAVFVFLNARDGVVLYAQAWKPLLTNAVALMLISHNMDTVRRIADSVVRLNTPGLVD